MIMTTEYMYEIQRRQIDNTEQKQAVKMSSSASKIWTIWPVTRWAFDCCPKALLL